MILIVSLVYVAKIVAGWMLLHLLWDSREIKHLLFKFFLGTGVGFGVSSLFYFLWSLARLPVVGYPYFELFFFLILLAAVFFKEYKHKKNTTLLRWRMPETRTLIWVGLVCLSVVISAASFWLYALKNPHGYNDAWDIWNSAARFIYLAGDRWMFFIPKAAWYHPDYPLMLSLNVAEGWMILGSDSTRIPMIVAFIFFLSNIGLLFSALTIAKDMEQGALAALVIASVPQLPFLSAWQYADVPLSYLFLATAALFYIYTIIGETKLLILAGLFAGLSAWTKNEGTTFALISIMLCFVLSILQRKNLLKHFIAGVIFPALTIMFFKTLTPPNDLFVDKAKSIAQLLDPSRYQIIFSKIIDFSFSFGGWPLSFLLILLCYFLFVFTKPKLDGKLSLPFFLCLLQFVGYFVIYLITPHELKTHLNTSLDRLLFHLFPLTMFLIFNVLPSPKIIFSKEAMTER